MKKLLLAVLLSVSTPVVAAETEEIFTVCMPLNALAEPYVKVCTVPKDPTIHEKCECDEGYNGFRLLPIPDVIPISASPA